MERAPRRVPTRSCVACRTARPKRELVRVVRTPDGAVHLDETGRLAGRGAYLCRDAACWRAGLERGGLQRALSTAIPAPLRATLEAGSYGGPEDQHTNTDMSTMTRTGGERRGEE